jgi:hypothetical protein
MLAVFIRKVGAAKFVRDIALETMRFDLADNLKS